MGSVLVVDDDRAVLLMVEKTLGRAGHAVITAESAQSAMDCVRSSPPDVVLLDIVLPGETGLSVFRRIQAVDRRLPVIFITAGAGSQTAIEAMQLGAYDYVAKPLDAGTLIGLVARAIETRRMMSVPVALPRADSPDSVVDVVLGRSPAMLNVFKDVGRVARQNVTVLIRGESGSGKELVARALYQHSARRDAPFMIVNCAALPETLLESELFGHEQGAFTGAEHRRIGKFEQCNGGTLLLDEVGDMSLPVQGKVLRLLQEQRFERVGGTETVETNVRLIAATNRPLEEMVADGRFRSDLLYRLKGVTISLPPLRDRKEDLPLLLRHFLAQAATDLGKRDIEGVAPEALELLMQYDWPGNIRELQSVVRQCVLKASGPVIVPEFLPDELHGPGRRSVPAAVGGGPPSDLGLFVEERISAGSSNLYAEAVEMMERFVITRVLRQTAGNQSRAAEILGITRGKIRDRITAFGIAVGKTVSIDPPE
jgi:DNA-binding NtrC family response regulator